ncbi:UNVERIFIED_CONTAM: hypothetical protein Sradi_6896800 [Sesamum radiatum]|uniref:Uncharacterized protein n=1 Tax=Sesamum radiatum TaxID=300843 RepID=A0AAW2JI37_SESRA
MVSSKKRIRPLLLHGSGISYALGDMLCFEKSCGYSRCPNRIGSCVEQLDTTWSQVLSIAAWSRIGTDAQFHTLDRGWETVDGRTVPVRTRGLNVYATFHLVTMSHGPLLDGHPWLRALSVKGWSRAIG